MATSSNDDLFRLWSFDDSGAAAAMSAVGSQPQSLEGVPSACNFAPRVHENRLLLATSGKCVIYVLDVIVALNEPNPTNRVGSETTLVSATKLREVDLCSSNYRVDMVSVLAWGPCGEWAFHGHRLQRLCASLV